MSRDNGVVITMGIIVDCLALENDETVAFISVLFVLRSFRSWKLIHIVFFLHGVMVDGVFGLIETAQTIP